MPPRVSARECRRRSRRAYDGLPSEVFPWHPYRAAPLQRRVVARRTWRPSTGNPLLNFVDRGVELRRRLRRRAPDLSREFRYSNY